MMFLIGENLDVSWMIRGCFMELLYEFSVPCAGVIL